MSVSVMVVLEESFCNNSEFPYATTQNVHTCKGQGADKGGGYCMLCCRNDPSKNAIDCLNPLDYEYPTVYPRITYATILIVTGAAQLVASPALLFVANWVQRFRSDEDVLLMNN